LNNAVVIKDLTIDGDEAAANYTNGGGAIYVRGGEATIRNCVIKNCETTANYYGGAVSMYNVGTLTLTNCSFINNKAKSNGGAIDIENKDSKLYATNCTFYGNNSGKYGGAVYSYNAGGEIKNCTIVNNNATTRGGGLCGEGGTIATRVTATNCIIVRNTASSGPDIYTANDGGYNLYGTTGGTFNKASSSTSGVTSPDTWLASGEPKDNGGNGLPTIALMDVSGSPAIDKLTSNSSAPSTDQRGLARDAAPDIGAYEYVAVPQGPTVTGVTVSPASAKVTKGESQQFTAEVTGERDPDQAVTWSVSGNNNSNTTIDSNTGLLTVVANETASSLTVTATSDYDDTKSGAAVVTVASAFYVDTAAEFDYAMGKASTSLPIYIEADITGVDNATLSGGGKDITVYGQGHTIAQADGGVTAHLDGSYNKLTIKDLTIEGSAGARTNKNGGGAVYLESGDVHLEDVTIRDCSVKFSTDNPSTNGLKYGGAAVSVALNAIPNATASNGKITAVNCAFIGNEAGHTYDAPGGGALSADKVDLTNCTFTGNRAADSMGGAVYARMGGYLVNCTIVNNYAGLSGGGAATRTEPVNGGYTYLHLLNCIVAANTTGGTVGKSAVNIDHVYDQGGNIFGYIHTVSDSDYRDEVYSANGTRKPADGSVWNVTEGVGAWLDSAAQDNGGKTPIVALKDATASPAIDKGVAAGTVESYYTALVLSAPAADQRGEPRDGKPDIGAYEFTGTLTPAVLNVSVAPKTATVVKGKTQTFSVTIEVWAGAAQTVTWSVDGESSADTTINADGLLTVATDETAETLTVKAASAVDGNKYDTATVTVKTPVDFSALESKITGAKDIPSGAYTTGTWNALQSAIAAAEELLDEGNATQDEVNAALTALETAVDNLSEKATPAHLMVLEGIVNSYNSKFSESNYTTESWAVFKEALDEAKAILDSPDDYRGGDVVAAGQALNAASGGLVRKADKSNLQGAVDAARNMLLPENVGKYIEASVENLEEALEAASDVMDDPDATQGEIDDAFADLFDAIRQMYEAGDKEALQTLVDIVSSVSDTLYTLSSYETFANALDAANSVLDNRNALKEDVDTAFKDLLDTFDKLILRADTAALNASVAQAQQILENDKDYVESSLDGLEAVLDAAVKVLDDSDATQGQVDDARTALNKEIFEARLKPERSALLAALTAASTYSAARYAPAGFFVLSAAVQKGEVILTASDEDVTQEQVDEAAAAIYSAIASLKPAESAGPGITTDTSNPVADTSNPVTDTSNPVAGTSNPAADTSSPGTDTSSSVADTSKSTTDKSKSVADKPTSKTDSSGAKTDASGATSGGSDTTAVASGGESVPVPATVSTDTPVPTDTPAGTDEVAAGGSAAPGADVGGAVIDRSATPLASGGEASTSPVTYILLLVAMAGWLLWFMSVRRRKKAE
jgi:hypothetical protein